MDQERLEIIFRNGLAKARIKENMLQPIVVSQYKKYCEHLITESGRQDLEQLCRLAHFGPLYYLKNPTGEMPNVSFEDAP